MLNHIAAATLSFASRPGAYVFGLLTPFMASHGVLAYFIVMSLNAAFAGPLLMILCGRLMMASHLEFLPMVVAVTIGDALNDRFYYWLGYAFGTRISLARKWRIVAQDRLRKRPVTTLLAAKVLYGPGIAALISAGEVRMPYLRRYAPACVVSSLMQSCVYLRLGPVLNSWLHVWMDVMTTLMLLGACVLLLKTVCSVYAYWFTQRQGAAD